MASRSVRHGLAAMVAGWLVLGLPGSGLARDFIVALQRPDGAVPFAEFHCRESEECTGTASIYFRDDDIPATVVMESIPVTFVMEVYQDSLRFASIDWLDKAWHFSLEPDGGGDFPIGRAAATLWLESAGLAVDPIVHIPRRIPVERFFVTLVPADGRWPGPSDDGGRRKIPM